MRRFFSAYVADLLWVVMLRRESQPLPDALHQKNTYQNCHFGPISVALLIHACAAAFVVGTFVTLWPFACFFWRVSPGGPLGSPLGSPWVSLRPLGGPLPGQIALFVAPCLECVFLGHASYYKWPFPGLGASPARFPHFWVHLPGCARPQQNIRIFVHLNEQQLKQLNS